MRGYALSLLKIVQVFFVIASLSIVSGCDTAKERAEKHFQNALTLLQAGDEKRAIIEFRNVFQLDGQHREARKAYAKMQRDRGNIREAIGQYLRLVEQYPDDLEGQSALADMNVEIGNWEEAKRHDDAALAIDPKDPIALAVKIAVTYQQAVQDKADADRAQAVAAAVEMKATMPEYLPLRQVIIDNHLRNNEFGSALTEIDEAITVSPDNRQLYGLRLSVLSALGDTGAIEEQLRKMVDIFADDPAPRTMLVRWYVSRKELDKAEEYLRGAIDPASDSPEAELTLVRFLAELRGNDAAVAELDNAIKSGKSTSVFRSIRAGLIFDAGRQDEAITELRGILQGMPVGDEERNIKVALARMLIRTGNAVGARQYVEEVLSEDATHVDALKLKGDWLIGDDKVSEALVALRSALEQRPRDPGIMTLMARAYERDGNQQLVGEMLSLAVDASDAAPDESIRYAKYLIANDKSDTAEEVLVKSLRTAPSNPQVLNTLGQLYVKKQDWPRADQVAQTLLGIDTPDAQNLGKNLKANILQAQNKTDEAVQYLESLIAQGQADLGAKLGIVRNYLVAGDTASAKAYVADLLKETPDDAGVRFIAAAVDASMGDVASAEAVYKKLLDEDQSRFQVWVALFRIQVAQGKTEEANATVNAAMKIFPDNPTLDWIRAGQLEKDGKPDEAIAIYEKMYAANSDNLIIANNLASLLSDARTDAASHDRAYTIARRLRGSDVAPFQDTYGWVAFLHGDTAEALTALESAANGLPGDPTVQYHLAKAYVAADRPADALVQFKKVLALTSEADSRSFVEESRSEIARLEKVSTSLSSK